MNAIETLRNINLHCILSTRNVKQKMQMLGYYSLLFIWFSREPLVGIQAVLEENQYQPLSNHCTGMAMTLSFILMPVLYFWLWRKLAS